jgi:O-methyltransferase
MGNTLSLLKKTEGIKGDVIEFGIASGGSTIIMAHFLKQINSKRKIYGCDTFEGLPYEDKFSLKVSEKVTGKFSHSLESVHAKIKKFNVDDKIILVKGMFEDTLYSELAEKQFSFVFNDCDLYNATKYALDFVWPRLSKNGFIKFDNYYITASDKKRPLWGETKAVDEFCTEKKIKIHLHRGPMLIK